MSDTTIAIVDSDFNIPDRGSTGMEKGPLFIAGASYFFTICVHHTYFNDGPYNLISN